MTGRTGQAECTIERTDHYLIEGIQNAPGCLACYRPGILAYDRIPCAKLGKTFGYVLACSFKVFWGVNPLEVNHLALFCANWGALLQKAGAFDRLVGM